VLVLITGDNRCERINQDLRVNLVKPSLKDGNSAIDFVQGKPLSIHPLGRSPDLEDPVGIS